MRRSRLQGPGLIKQALSVDCNIALPPSLSLVPARSLAHPPHTHTITQVSSIPPLAHHCSFPCLHTPHPATATLPHDLTCVGNGMQLQPESGEARNKRWVEHWPRCGTSLHSCDVCRVRTDPTNPTNTFGSKTSLM